MAGSLVSTRRSFSPASAVPSATQTWPAWMERPMPTPPPWWIETQDGARRGVHERVEQRPVGDGVGAVEHRLGLAVGRGDRAAVEVVATDHEGRLHRARRHELVERHAGFVALFVPEPADSRGQALKGDAVLGLRDPAAKRDRCRGRGRGPLDRSRRCRPGHPTARPNGRAPCLRKRADGCRRGRSRDRRRRAGTHPAAPRRAASCRSRRPRRLRP